MALSSIQDAILRTLIYHGVFNYPLSRGELQRYLITKTRYDHESVSGTLETIDTLTINEGRYSYGSSLPYNPEYAHRAYTYLDTAQALAHTIARFLPDILCVGVSGSVGALYANNDSDIDLFIITKPNSRWLVRAILLTYLKLCRLHVNTRLHPTKNAGKFCVNLIVEDTDVGRKDLQKDLFTAMEIAHLKIVFNRKFAFERFLLSNSWIKDTLANFWEQSKYEWSLSKAIHISPPRETRRLLNSVFGKLQKYVYKIKHGNKLTTNSTWIHDYRATTLEKYTSKTEELLGED